MDARGDGAGVQIVRDARVNVAALVAGVVFGILGFAAADTGRRAQHRKVQPEMKAGPVDLRLAEATVELFFGRVVTDAVAALASRGTIVGGLAFGRRLTAAAYAREILLALRRVGAAGAPAAL